MRWKTWLAIAATSAVALYAIPASAQSTQVTRFVSGSTPGGGVDTLSRVLSDSMAASMGRTIIVENKPGAGYTIATDHVAKSKPDGNTVLITFNVQPTFGLVGSKLSFDPVKDFRAVGMIATTPYVIVANPNLPGADLKQALALAKTQGRSLTFGSIGLGTPQHLMMERLKAQTGVDIRMIHYKGVSAMMDVIGGTVDFSLLTPSSSEAQVKNGRLKALAVSSPNRLPELPNVATVAEQGYQGFISDGWYAMMLPAKTPPAIVQAYNKALNEALVQPTVRDRMRALNATPAPGTPEVLDQLIRDDAKTWRKVIEDNKIKAE
ncbi:Bug family tripartite tricarboxylate transporter substrate binding protein [Ottowia thiooxydans]|uniref:Tripartite-type tricarboxylate transporter receptor subunit TctC n=1 Tax=Ottowia thiooxydans TaxID=219182 RepID=A0ABV2QFJ3_9BURK